MAAQASFTLLVAADDRIESIRGSGAALVLAAGSLPLEGVVPGTAILSLFPDERLRQLYRHLLAGVRAGIPAAYDTFLDAGGVRTWAGVSLSPAAGDGVQVVATWQREEPAPGAASPAGRAAGSASGGGHGAAETLLRVCSWCSRVETGSGTGEAAVARWEGIGAAVARLGLLRRDVPAELSHGICPDCSAEQSRGL